MASRRTAALLVSLLAGWGLVACTSGDSSADDPSTPVTTAAVSTSPPAPSTSPTPDVTLDRQSVDFEANVAEVTGRMPKAERHRLRKQLAAPVQQWVTAGFLRGPYPRTDFSTAFGSWTKEAGSLAARDSDVTTNAALGPDLVAVVADERSARMYVFGIDDVPGGATARVRLRLTAERSNGSLIHIRVAGELYLTPQSQTKPSTRRDRWQVFGYDLQRTVTPA